MSLLALPAFLTRRREDTTMPETVSTNTEKPAANILLRFRTQGGATVIVTGSGSYGAEDNRWKCLGCDDGLDRFSSSRYLSSARDSANSHANNCRSMPKPEA